jgi:hypothetical protein
MVVLEARSPFTFLGKPTVSNFEHEGHTACPISMKQALQKTCSQAVTCNNKKKLLDGKSIKD